MIINSFSIWFYGVDTLKFNVYAESYVFSKGTEISSAFFPNEHSHFSYPPFEGNSEDTEEGFGVYKEVFYFKKRTR